MVVICIIDINSHFEVFILSFDLFAQKCKLDVTEQEVEEVLGEKKIDSQRTRNLF